MSTPDYLETNKAAWNAKVNYHLKSDFYNLEGFLAGETSLKSIELDLLGDITGKSLLHLQCHFGQDTISLARMGASATGIDLSDEAIKTARNLSAQTNTNVNFICSDVYDLPNHLDEKFDIVFTSYGTIGWLPDINQWAEIVSKHLNPGGKFVIVEFHPVVWMHDDDFTKIAYSYFKADPIVEIETGTYADNAAPIENKTITWNHGLGSVLSSLINNGIEINSVDEFDFSPYDCFNQTEEFEAGKFRIKHLENKIPMTYAITGTKK